MPPRAAVLLGLVALLGLAGCGASRSGAETVPLQAAPYASSTCGVFGNCPQGPARPLRPSDFSASGF